MNQRLRLSSLSLAIKESIVEVISAFGDIILSDYTPMEQMRSQQADEPSHNHNPHELIHSTKRYKSIWPILRAVLCYNLGSVYFGYTLVYFNAIKYTEIQDIFNIDLDVGIGEGLYSGLIEFGAVFGAVASRFILKYCTRKQSFYMANMIAFVAGLMILAASMKTLLVGRVMQGAAVGIFSSIVPLTVREYVPVEISGFMGSFFAPSVVLGSFLGYLLPYILSFSMEAQDYWKFTFGLSLAIICLQTILLTLIYTSETPKYLIRKGRIDEAKELILQIYKEEYIEEVFIEKMSELKITHLRSTKNLESPPQRQPQRQPQKKEVEEVREVELEEQKESSKSMKIEKGNMEEDFPKSTEGLNESHQEGFFWDEDTVAKYPKDIPKAKFIAFWMELFQNLAGIYVVTLYGRQLARIAMPDLVDILPVLLNMWRLAMSVVGILLIKKYGRKRILVPGVAVMAVGLLGLFIGFKAGEGENGQAQGFLFLCLLVMISTFAISISPITWLYIPEIVQPPLIPFTTIVNWGSAYLIVFLFPIIRENFTNKDTPYLFLFFAICMVVHTLVLWVVMRETRYRSESQIRQFYREPLRSPLTHKWYH